ncbi:hypothetical protein LF1_23810 [Rubripirellula obstinata]|uniref:FecR protein n=1 Tax=Rubripirellula obstinata TaxID=406547 RepID=A0A5B1CKJ3_9BACT|nr:LamG domain-containing protein [Rubripirellula obstinata]KAA1259844.1 hypothetical protein LF1_23810 [Rubripirellula obstinata]
MTIQEKDLRALRTLILKSQSESLSEAETSELERLCRIDGGAKEVAALIDQLCAFGDSGSLDSLPMAKLLAEAFGNESRPHFKSAPGRVPLSKLDRNVRGEEKVAAGSSRWTNSVWLIGLAASHLFIASLVWSFANSSSSNDSTAVALLEASRPQLVSMTACVWRDSDGPTPSLGQSIRFGEMLDLAEGVAELKIGEGTSGEALVRVEGPASVYIHGDGQLELRNGSLTVKSLGTGSEQVLIITPIGLVMIDGQSSIGLMSQASVNEVHLFAGRGLIEPIRSFSRSKQLRLEAGEAVRFSTSSGSERLGPVMFEASMSSFVSARSSGFDPLNIGQDYVDAVLESKPSVYWRFEELLGESPYFVANQGSAPDMDAEMFGESGWRRYGENRVAELGKIGTSSGFASTGTWPPKPLANYTIEMWVKPELYHHGEMFCMHEPVKEEDGRYSHSMMIETLVQHWKNPLEDFRPHRFRFVHRTPSSGVVTDGSNLVGGQPYQVRTWQHLAAQKQGDRVSLWIDGRLAIEQLDPDLLNENLQIVIGQLYLTRTERRFVGQIDEVAIYDRCLSPEELRGHIIAAGRSVAVVESN